MVPSLLTMLKAEGFLFDESGKITGVVARDLLTDQVFEIKARLVINTTGPWATRYVICLIREPNSHKCVQLRGSLGSGLKQDRGFHSQFTLIQVWVMAVWSLFSTLIRPTSVQ